jgi:hypothetical protein
MLFRSRPLVFVSSSIEGLRALRSDIRAAVEDLDLADSWLFELHAVASGEPPEAQYLQAARDCDIFVVVVGDDVGRGTLEEYAEALSDNPVKIIPFLLGPSGPGSDELRATLRERHTYQTLEHQELLPGAIAAAVAEYLTTGKIARSGLVQGVESRRGRLRAIIGLPPGFAFSRRLGGVTAPVVNDLLVPGARFLLHGLPGSGKSDASMAALLVVAQDNVRLAREGH